MVRYYDFIIQVIQRIKIHKAFLKFLEDIFLFLRSEERRVGKECAR